MRGGSEKGLWAIDDVKVRILLHLLRLSEDGCLQGLRYDDCGEAQKDPSGVTRKSGTTPKVR